MNNDIGDLTKSCSNQKETQSLIGAIYKTEHRISHHLVYPVQSLPVTCPQFFKRKSLQRLDDATHGN